MQCGPEIFLFTECLAPDLLAPPGPKSYSRSPEKQIYVHVISHINDERWRERRIEMGEGGGGGVQRSANSGMRLLKNMCVCIFRSQEPKLRQTNENPYSRLPVTTDRKTTERIDFGLTIEKKKLATLYLWGRNEAA